MSPSASLTRSSVSAIPDRTSRAGLIGSALLHVGIIVATLFTWTHTLDIADQSSPIVPVDLITVGDKTNVAPMVQQRPKDIAPDEIQPPQLEAPKMPAMQMQAAEAAPPPDKLAAAKLPKPIPEQAKPKPQPDAKKDKFDINNIVALLDKHTPASSASQNAKVGARTIKGIGAQNAMTADLVDALRSQIAQCWSPPVGAPRAAQVVVDFDLFLNLDGSVAQPPQLSASSAAAAASDPYTRAAAEAARRAIFACAPYKLPADRYSQWREINPFHFDPRQMMGQ